MHRTTVEKERGSSALQGVVGDDGSEADRWRSGALLRGV
jgi:hypothetical protein